MYIGVRSTRIKKSVIANIAPRNRRKIALNHNINLKPYDIQGI